MPGFDPYFVPRDPQVKEKEKEKEKEERKEIVLGSFIGAEKVESGSEPRTWSRTEFGEGEMKAQFDSNIEAVTQNISGSRNSSSSSSNSNVDNIDPFITYQGITDKKEDNAIKKQIVSQNISKKNSGSRIRADIKSIEERGPVVVIIRHGKTEYNKLGLFTGIFLIYAPLHHEFNYLFFLPSFLSSLLSFLFIFFPPLPSFLSSSLGPLLFIFSFHAWSLHFCHLINLSLSLCFSFSLFLSLSASLSLYDCKLNIYISH